MRQNVGLPLHEHTRLDAELIDQIEDRVYRGALYDLNEVLSGLHEAMVADDLWPLPSYREMLFIK